MLLIYLAIAWASGIFIASAIPVPIEIWLWWLVLPLGLFAVWRHNSFLRIVHLSLLVLLLGALRYTLALAPAQWTINNLAYYNDHGTAFLVGTVSDMPEVRDYNTRVRLNVSRIRVQNEWHEVAGLALVIVPREADIRYGDSIQIFGEPATPPEFDDFSYKDYLARQGIHSLVRVYGNVQILARGQGESFWAVLYSFRERALQTINAIFPEPAASLLAGILIGDEAGIPANVRDAFNTTNTAHIIAISGFNITLIAGLLAQLARRIVGAKRATLIVILGLVIYTLLVGAGASVVRAAIMGSLSVIAVHYHRPNTALIALAVAALVMLVLDPFTLFDVGFQLSFLATLGLILYVAPLTRAFENALHRFTSAERAQQIVGTLSDTFIVSIAAQITTTPLIAFTFHRLSFIGLFANFLILPAQPAVMIWGGLATMTAMIFQPIGQAIAWIAWTFLEFTILVVQAVAQIPLAAIEVERFDILILAAYYLLLFIATQKHWLEQFAPPPKTSTPHPVSPLPISAAFVLGIALIAGVWIGNLTFTIPDNKIHIEFLDTGGAATFVRTPNGARVLIDGGASPSAILSALGEQMPFWDRTIDVIVVTNFDEAHFAGLDSVLERFAVRQVIQVAQLKDNAATRKWNDLLAQNNIPLLSAQPGLQINLDERLYLRIAHLSEDAQRAAVQISAANTSILLADSANIDDQDALSAQIIDPTIVVVPRKLAGDFIGTVNPQFEIVFGNDTPLSAEFKTALEGVTVLETGARGTIEFVGDGQRLAVRTER